MGLTVLDAGVLIAVLDGRDVHHAAARSALTVAAATDELILPASAYAEVLVLPSRLGEAAIAQADAFVDTIRARVEPATRMVAAAAAMLRARHGQRVKLADALVIATATALAADRILTTDRDWPDVGIRVEIIGAAA